MNGKRQVERARGKGKGMKEAASRGRALPHVLLCCLCAALVFLSACPGAYAQKKGDTLDRRVSELEKEVARLKREIEFFHLDAVPDNLTLCGRKIPLTRDDIRERFEREFYQLLENKGLITVIVKRYLKYQGLMNDEIQKMSLPADLVYLVVTESYLNPRALSKANAAGLWQFIKETGKREGLYVSEHVDERYNVRKATRSGLTHLKKLHAEFGDWFVAMAAYNAGNGRLREATENQETKDFFDLYLPEETERYIFRIIALKELITNREKYGIQLDEKELYKPIYLSEVVLETDKELHGITFSKCMDVTYKTFRELNLHLRKYRLPKGTYVINVPVEKKEVFLKRLRNNPNIEVIRGNN
jgi:membrane-bound lytic murein transglycosylase D